MSASEDSHATRALIGLGSNQGDPERQVRRALEALAKVPQTRVRRHSRLFRTAPWGFREQPAFVNAVAELATTLDADDLFAALLSIEREQGRRRDGHRWGPRTLDLDLLTFGDLRSSATELVIPHPRIAERAFVLVPAADLDADLLIPGVGRVRDLVAGIDASECAPID
jgi:2-amino-4-hydroxy-6-hydroxymethyldihydropteridine diphosphokinase